MHCEELTLASDGLTLAARLHRPAAGDAAPALILCHGFGSCKENQAGFAAEAVARGWVVLSFDFRGHGASDGCLDSRTVHDVGAALTWLQNESGIDTERIVVRGTSMGGYWALLAARAWPALAACVALNPLDEPALGQVLRDADDPETPLGRWRAGGTGFPRVMGCDLACWLESHDVYAAVGEIAPRPLLLIHATGDARAAARISEDLYAAAGEPRTLWLIDAGDHCSPGRDPAVTARTLDWLDAVR